MAAIIVTNPVAQNSTTINPTNYKVPVRQDANTFVDSAIYSNGNTYTVIQRSTGDNAMGNDETNDAIFMGVNGVGPASVECNVGNGWVRIGDPSSVEGPCLVIWEDLGLHTKGNTLVVPAPITILSNRCLKIINLDDNTTYYIPLFKEP
jgi:hypothetical protein